MIELKVNNSYLMYVRKDLDRSFSMDDLERQLKAEPDLTIRFINKNFELVSIICDDYKIKNLKRKYGDRCLIKQNTVRY